MVDTPLGCFSVACRTADASGAAGAVDKRQLLRPVVLDLVGHAVLPAAPARRHAIGRALEHSLDLVQQSLLDLEELSDFPRPRLLRPSRNRAAVGRLELAR